ncbi:MAG: hypothetical protein J6X21_05550 [Bacteroidaceae bacterium]|nr:hypothetical protein [Bacteroidaceae bacterium]
MTMDVDYCRMAVGMIVGGWLLERDCWRETVGGRMFVGGYILKEVKPDGSPLLIRELYTSCPKQIYGKIRMIIKKAVG